MLRRFDVVDSNSKHRKKMYQRYKSDVMVSFLHPLLWKGQCAFQWMVLELMLSFSLCTEVQRSWGITLRNGMWSKFISSSMSRDAFLKMHQMFGHLRYQGSTKQSLTEDFTLKERDSRPLLLKNLSKFHDSLLGHYQKILQEFRKHEVDL